jgi:hypothetical protein
LQRVTKSEDLGLVTRETKVSIPRETIDGYFEELLDHETWQSALIALVSIAPPSGITSQNQIQVDRMATDAPLLARIATLKLGAGNLPELKISGDEKNDYNLAWVELRSIQIQGPLLAEVLKRIGEKWGIPAEEDLVAFFSQRPHVQLAVARALARALVRFYNEDFEGAAFTAVPRVERLARDLLLAEGAAVFRPEVSGRPGGYLGLGTILGMLLDLGVDESWARFIDTFLSRRSGANLRNNMLHGLVDDANLSVAGLILISAIYLAVKAELP